MGVSVMTDVQIWNVAMTYLALPVVSSISGTTAREVRMIAMWPMVRKRFIDMHEWNGAKQTIEDLEAEASPTPAVERWKYTFDISGIENLIRVLRVNGGPNKAKSLTYGEEFEIEQVHAATGSGNAATLQLLCDVDEIDLEVLLDIPVEDNLGKLLGDSACYALGVFFAAELAPAMGKDLNQISYLQQKSREVVRDARALDSQQGTPRWFQDDSLIRARTYGLTNDPTVYPYDV